MQIKSVGFGVVIALVVVVTNGGIALAVCPCNADVDNSGSVLVTDVATVRDCINGLCGQCVNSCDVDCDGDVDYYDAGVVACAFDGFSNCCTKADGACTGANNGVGGPLCVVTTDNYCTLFTGTWHGDLTICQGDNAIDIPAASTWSLVALAISVLIASTIILRNRNPAMR